MKESLMFGCLGNGITVSDRNRTLRGDYATVAHIAQCGLVHIYSRFLSEEALAAIRSMAQKKMDEFFDRWNQWSEEGRVSVMDRELSYDAFYKLFKENDLFTMTAEESFKVFLKMKAATSMYEFPVKEEEE